MNLALLDIFLPLCVCVRVCMCVRVFVTRWGPVHDTLYCTNAKTNEIKNNNLFETKNNEFINLHLAQKTGQTRNPLGKEACMCAITQT